jgi:hypothetical protein
MNRDTRARLRKQLDHWKERMAVEINVGGLRALLDECDRLEDERDEAVDLLGYERRQSGRGT